MKNVLVKGNTIQLIFSRLEDTLWDAESFWAAVGLYLVWQIGYWVITEVIYHFDGIDCNYQWKLLCPDFGVHLWPIGPS